MFILNLQFKFILNLKRLHNNLYILLYFKNDKMYLFLLCDNLNYL